MNQITFQFKKERTGSLIVCFIKSTEMNIKIERPIKDAL